MSQGRLAESWVTHQEPALELGLVRTEAAMAGAYDAAGAALADLVCVAGSDGARTHH
jgi:hypothetical protein